LHVAKLSQAAAQLSQVLIGHNEQIALGRSQRFIGSVQPQYMEYLPWARGGYFKYVPDLIAKFKMFFFPQFCNFNSASLPGSL
jgi:hypothetical protein